MAIDDNTSYELTGYQVKDLASKIRAKADSNSLASVATSGLYSDLTGAPTIPTVYNGTLTIQQNGTTLGTFSANQDTNETINITGGGSSVTTFYWKAGANAGLYKDSGMTIAATLSDVTTAMAGGLVYVYMPQSGVYETAITNRDSYPFFTTVSGSTTNSEKLKSVRYTNSGGVWTRSVVDIQNELTAGTGISISAQNVISATGGGATVVDLYWDYTTSNLYKESSMTNVVSNSEVYQAFQAGNTIYIHDSTNQFEFEVIYQVIAYDSDSYTMTAVSGARVDSYDGNIPDLIVKYTYDYLHTEWTRAVTSLEPFTGATSGASGSAGLVPAPTTSDPDKFLKGDGTWGTPTDTTYSDFTGATSSVAGAHGLVPAPAAGDEAKALHGDGTWKDTTAKLVEMSYGESNAWTKFINAYNAGSIVYCRASSNANPATGSQTRKAFMAYVNNAATPTSVEFQYVRSVSSKTEAQPVDQVFVYTLTNTNGGTWTVASRNMGPKLAAGTNTTVSYSSGTYTVNANISGSNYSTTEIDTGSTWIDGSAIYKKTVNFGALPNATSKTVAHGISNLSRVIEIEGYAYRSGDSVCFPIPYEADGASAIGINTNATNISIATGVDRTNITECYVTLYYTKSS